MTTIAFAPARDPRGDPWPAIAAQVRAWAAQREVELRDAILLLPFAQLLPLARKAFARAGGWMPRIETTQTLAASLGPGPRAAAGQLSLDTGVDRLSAAQLLREQSWAADWERSDPRDFEQAAADLAQAAQALWRAAAAHPPTQRERFWQTGRALLVPAPGPGGRERLLARVALEWAAAGPAPDTDALLALRPSAWMAVQAGGADEWVAQLLASAASDVPTLLLDTDPPLHEPFSGLLDGMQVGLAVCDDFEDEAQQAAAQVLAHLRDGMRPVALVAQDRVLVRRVRALLSRHRVPLLDETGWKLSTTRAAAGVLALLRAARATAGTDDWLDWLKAHAAGWPGPASATRALPVLEQALRRRGASRPQALPLAALDADAAALWRAAEEVLNHLEQPGRRSLVRWLDDLGAALAACGAWDALAADDAGRQVVAALRLGATGAHGGAWLAAARGTLMDLERFIGWVEATLEQGSFRPAAPAADPAVIVTPLMRALLRPFAAVVFPGADESHLGAWPEPPALIDDALALAWGLPATSRRRDAETVAFAQLLRGAPLALLRRRQEAGTPLAASALVERLEAARQSAGLPPLAVLPDARVDAEVAPRPVARPAPAAGALLPARLSASACEALRACPYRFFAQYMLGLREDEELDDELEKRDYGTWLHAVLHRFHEERGQPAAPEAEEARLVQVARELQQAQALDEAAFLPFAASFGRFVPRYIAWLHRRDAEGAQWLEGERDLHVAPMALGGVELYGRLDRVDRMPRAQGPALQLIDYKTGSVQRLRDQLKQPQEDTQLAFYAALMAGQASDVHEVEALYLAVDDGQGIRELPHRDVGDSAARLVAGLAQDLERIRGGAGLPALGEGVACDFCLARGLCRRDHWTAEAAT